MNKPICMVLDISKNATGFTIMDVDMRYINGGVLEKDPSINTTVEVKERLVRFIAKKAKKYGVTDITVENTFAGQNRETNRLLDVLNESASEANYRYNLNCSIRKEENTSWKSDLIKLAESKTGKRIILQGRHKLAVQDALEALGYSLDKIRARGISNDFTDALGLCYISIKKLTGQIESKLNTAESPLKVKYVSIKSFNYMFIPENKLEELRESLPEEFVVINLMTSRSTLEKRLQTFFSEKNLYYIPAIFFKTYTQLGADIIRLKVEKEVVGLTDFYLIPIHNKIKWVLKTIKEIAL